MTGSAQCVRNSVKKMEDGRTARDYWIREMRSEGASLREIAEVAGMSAAGVAKIIEREA